MSVILLANVGNSDLVIEPKDLLPKPKMSSRELGKEVLENYQKYQANIKLPLIWPTLTYIAKKERIKVQDIKVHLFASDQPHNMTDPEDWQKDTIIIAQVIQKYLMNEKMPKKSIEIHQIEGSPADYTNALEFHFNILKKIKSKEDENARYYMEVSGGTPAMTAMLILMGAEIFGQHVQTLYLDRNREEPYFIDVAQVLFARKTRETLFNQINLYAYASALDTLENNDRLVIHDERTRNLVKQLLRYGDRRLAFDYEGAREALREAHATGEIQTKIRFWQRELREEDSAKVIAELINSAIIKLKLGEYADFTQRIFRFQEATLRYMAEKMGIKYSKKDGQSLDNSWRENNKDLDNYLKAYPRDQKGKLQKQTFVVETQNRALNRYSLGAIVEYFVTHDSQWSHLKPALDKLFDLSSIADLRNKGIGGHGFEGVSKANLESSYGQSTDILVENIKEIYRDVFEIVPPDNPYDDINSLIKSLIEGNA